MIDRDRLDSWPAARADLLGLLQTMRGRARATSDNLDLALDLAEGQYKAVTALAEVTLYVERVGGVVQVRGTLSYTQVNHLREILPPTIRFEETTS